MSDEKLLLPIPGRSVERSKGCWNCKSWCQDPDTVRSRYRALRAKALVRMRQLPQQALQRISGQLPRDARFYRRLGEGAAAGLTEEESIKRALSMEQRDGHTQAQANKLQFFDDKIRDNKMGMCLIGQAPGDFCEDGYLCHMWCGRDGHSLAKIGAPLEDTLPDETRDVIDGRAPKV